LQYRWLESIGLIICHYRASLLGIEGMWSRNARDISVGCCYAQEVYLDHR